MQALFDVQQRLTAADMSGLPIDELVWLLPVDFLPGATALFGIRVRRATHLDRPYLAHAAGDEHESAPLGDPTSPDTAYEAVATAMERWIEKHYTIDFYPDGQRGSRDVVQVLLNLGWRPPAELGDNEIQLHIQDNGGPGNGIVATADGGERFFPLPGRRQKISLEEIRQGLIDGIFRP